MPFHSVAAGMRRVIGLAPSRTATRPDQMQIVLPDLRATDSGFLVELRDGRFALTSGSVVMGAAGPFDGTIPDETVARELFSLDWLRHLHADRSIEGEDHTRRLLLAWARSRARRSTLANEPQVAARRAMALLAHVDTALVGATARDFDTLMDLVTDEFTLLTQATLRMPLALPRLTALIAATAYAVCRGDDAAARQPIERRLANELDRQVLGDGGHISRNPAALIEIVLDLVPLQRAYLAAHLDPPGAVPTALQRLRGMIDLLTHGDRQLGRFNGMGTTSLTDLFMILKSLAPPALVPATVAAVDTGYIRLVAGDAVVLFDAGPGAETLAGEAPFAGALSFEVSAGSCPLIVNAGSDHAAFGPRRLDARATAAHAALVVAGASSAPPTGARSGLARAALVTELGDTTPSSIKASTDGYRQRFGLVHHRTLALLRDGWLLEGSDRLESAGSTTDAAYAVHFHLHPSVHLESDAVGERLRLTAADGSRWAFSCSGASAHVEPSVFYASTSGQRTRQTLQIVLRGHTSEGAAAVTWRLERMSPAAVS